MMFKSHRIQPLLLTLVLFIMGVAMSSAQPGRFGSPIKAEGTVVDSKTGEPLVGAAVKVTSADGGTGTFGICDNNGKFSFEVRPGRYSLEITYVAYKTLHKEVDIWPNRAKIGTFKLKEDPHMLAEVETIGHSERIKQRGDTLAYNADAYKVQDGASAEELVAKMPGIEVSSSGVKAQGEEVKKILVDGKEFFDNDVKMALKSLPAEALESVNVYDKKSDQAEFTGIDDGETVKAMDLITKSYRRNGVFGKVFGGVGSTFGFDNGYWNTGFNLNVFEGSRRITFLGMSNNVNERNFSTDDMAGGMMGNRSWGASGVARTHGLGINFSNSYLDDKLNVELSYFFNQTRNVSGDTTYVDDLNKEASSYSESSKVSRSISHRIGGRLRFKPTERDEIMFRPNINFQQSHDDGLSLSRNWNYHLDQVVLDRQNLDLWDDVLSSSQKQTNTESDSWNVRGTLLWRHRLNKPGRTFSVNVNGGAGAGNEETQNNRLRTVAGITKPWEYQQNTTDSHNSSIGGNMQWTEPLATGLNLSLRYDVSFNQSKRDNAYNFFTDANYNTLDSIDVRNTNTYEQRNLRNSGELGLSFNKGTLRANANVRFQSSKLEGIQDYYLMSEADKGKYNFNTSKSFFSILPNLRIEYRTAGGTQFQFNYRSSTNNPSINNLQRSVNTTNPLSYSAGNPDLKESTSHNLNLRMIYTNTETAQNFMMFGGFNFTNNQISNQKLTNRTTEDLLLTSLDPSFGYSDDIFTDVKLAPGASITSPINRNGNMSAYFNMGYGFPFDLIWSNVNISMGGNYNLNPNSRLYYESHEEVMLDGKQLVNEVSTFETKTQTIGFNPRLHISSNISSDLNFNIMYAPSFQWVSDTEGNSENRDYINHSLNANLNWTFWEGFTTDQSIGYSRFGGPSRPEAIEQWIWNASLGKKFLKGNKAEIKLQAYDILGSNKGYSLTPGDSDIRISYRNFMPRYFLLTFTYKITAYKGNGGSAAPAGHDRGGFGGPGGGGWGGGRPF